MNNVIVNLVPFIALPPLVVFLWRSFKPWHDPRTPDAIAAAHMFADPRWLPSGWAAATFAFVYLGVSIVVRSVNLPFELLRAALLALPVFAFVWMVVAFIREFRAADELEHRVLADGLAFAFVSFLCGLVAMSMLDALTPGQPDRPFDPSLVFMPLNYFLGLFLAKGRYLPTTSQATASRSRS